MPCLSCDKTRTAVLALVVGCYFGLVCYDAEDGVQVLDGGSEQLDVADQILHVNQIQLELKFISQSVSFSVCSYQCIELRLERITKGFDHFVHDFSLVGFLLEAMFMLRKLHTL
jgi:hypothetical protein